MNRKSQFFAAKSRPSSERSGVHDRRQGAAGRLRGAATAANAEKLAVPIKIPTLPRLADHVPPFLPVTVAHVVTGGQLEAKHLVFGLIPAAHDVETEAARRDVIDGCELLRRDQRMNKRGVGSREHRDALGLRKQAGCPCDGFERIALEIGIAAVTGPARDRQYKLDPRRVGCLREREIIFPARVPALGHRGDRHAARAVRGKDPELESVAIEHRIV